MCHNYVFADVFACNAMLNNSRNLYNEIENEYLGIRLLSKFSYPLRPLPAIDSIKSLSVSFSLSVSHSPFPLSTTGMFFSSKYGVNAGLCKWTFYLVARSGARSHERNEMPFN